MTLTVVAVILIALVAGRRLIAGKLRALWQMNRALVVAAVLVACVVFVPAVGTQLLLVTVGLLGIARLFGRKIL